MDLLTYEEHKAIQAKKQPISPDPPPLPTHFIDSDMLKVLNKITLYAIWHISEQRRASLESLEKKKWIKDLERSGYKRIGSLLHVGMPKTAEALSSAILAKLDKPRQTNWRIIKWVSWITWADIDNLVRLREEAHEKIAASSVIDCTIDDATEPGGRPIQRYNTEEAQSSTEERQNSAEPRSPDLIKLNEKLEELEGRDEPPSMPSNTNRVAEQIACNILEIPYTVSEGISLLREVDRFRPFEYDDVPIAKIYWDIVVDKLHQGGLFLNWSGQRLKDHLMGILYRMGLKIFDLPQYEIVSFVRPAADTQNQILNFKTLLRVVLIAWNAREKSAEFRLLGPKHGYTESDWTGGSPMLRKKIICMIKKSMKAKRALELTNIEQRESGLNPPLASQDHIPANINNIKVDYLYGHRKGRPVEWTVYLKNNGIETIGDAGGWGSCKSDPSSFHSRIIKVLNQNEALRNDIELKQKIGEVRYHHVQDILENPVNEAFIKSKMPISKETACQSADILASRSNSAPKREPVVRVNDVLIQDLWHQTLIRALGRPLWLETLEDNNINTIGDLGGWKTSDLKFTTDLIKKLETELKFSCSQTAQRDIKLLKFDDVKDILDETKKVHIQYGIHQTAPPTELGISVSDPPKDPPESLSSSSHAERNERSLPPKTKAKDAKGSITPITTKKKLTALEKEVQDLLETNSRLSRQDSEKSGSDNARESSRYRMKRKARLHRASRLCSDSSDSDDPVQKRRKKLTALTSSRISKPQPPSRSSSPSPIAEIPGGEVNQRAATEPSAVSGNTKKVPGEMFEVTPESFHDGFLNDYQQMRTTIREMNERIIRMERAQGEV
ncbi:hypothetical protein Dda_0683 [Drechslerella dactyloides]|uniref:Uncharacterized protein n=1 Tax=Drechslerella dactyloides TaxID=74499 RepID=A0AAD6NM81_DREDA|nr:hypothetical protein Dda_0683 [Drechslerella dactyloides]